MRNLQYLAITLSQIYKLMIRTSVFCMENSSIFLRYPVSEQSIYHITFSFMLLSFPALPQTFAKFSEAFVCIGHEENVNYKKRYK
ncbi:MAG: hypothetical protein C0404_06285 [Verrucomicrobia bacterium]|nr:hypothetical protein [Verrucomicrobiota bacterium]